ncbi:MAG: hypothetical protein ACRD2Q_00185 [Terriglobales bacterium]
MKDVAPKLLVDWEPRWQAFTSALGPALQRTPDLPLHIVSDYRSGAPHLLVLWEDPWEGFCDRLKPALSRSARALKTECDPAPLTRRGAALSLLVHATVLLAMPVLAPWVFPAAGKLVLPEFSFPLIYYPPVEPPPQRASVGRPATQEELAREMARRKRELERKLLETKQEKGKQKNTEETRQEPRGSYPVQVQQSPDLPQMEDVGGAQEGRSGRSGGREAFHPTQTIRVARGPRMVERVVDAPKLNLPRSNQAVANLVAVAAAPPPPPPLEAAALGRRLVLPPELRPDVIRPAAQNLRRRNLPAVPTVGGPAVIPPPPDVVPAKASVADPRLVVPEPTVVEPTPANVGRDVRKFALGSAGATVAELAPGFEEGSPSGTRTTGDADNGAPDGRPDGVRAAAQGNGTDPNGAPNGNVDASGLVISTRPGDTIGVPGGEAGSLAMSPSGSGTTGLGGSGGGTGIGVGTGPGSGTHGDGPGGGSSGIGFGSDPNARGGISPGPGPGGSGGGTSRTGLAGVTIRGGVVNLPSFATGTAPTPPGRTPAQPGRRAPDLTVVATTRSGGALNAYGLLKGPRVYTIYIPTRLGTGVMQFSERPSDIRGFQAELTPPEPQRTDIPAGTQRSRLVVSCVMDRSGVLTNFRILEATTADLAYKMIAALKEWRFKPVLRGEEVIEVDAILGFAVGTK